jgi:hypothetical protein
MFPQLKEIERHPLDLADITESVSLDVSVHTVQHDVSGDCGENGYCSVRQWR